MSRMEYPVPSPRENFDFLVRCYFGADDDLLRLCVSRAYRDFARTLRGLPEDPTLRKALHDKGHACVRKLLDALRREPVTTQAEFDRWHEVACCQLGISCRDGDKEVLCTGQAQKWLNMSMKYVFTLGEDRLPGFARLYPFAHIPIDNILMDQVQKIALRKMVPVVRLPTKWSQLPDYAPYLRYQKDCRKLFAGSAPLAAEFRLWLSADEGGTSERSG